jgi:tetratricopeptide (TPR) repeat protein
MMTPQRCAWQPLLGVLLIVAILLTGVPAGAMTIAPEQQYAFATQLFNAGQFRRAAEEFQRFAFFFPDDGRRREAILRAGIAFLRAEEPDAALQEFNALAGQDPLDAIAVEAQFLIAESYLQLNAPTQSVLQLHNLIATSDDPGVRDRAYYRIAWIQIEQTDWQGARRTLSRIRPESPYPVERLLSALDHSDAIPRKSPTLAGTLSILPGAGQLYTGRYQDALTTFLLNGGLAWAAVEAFDNGQTALGSLIAFVGFGFYVGNIYGAVSSAHKYNQTQQERFAEELRHQNVLPASGPPQDRSDALFIRIAFRF